MHVIADIDPSPRARWSHVDAATAIAIARRELGLASSDGSALATWSGRAWHVTVGAAVVVVRGAL